MVMDRVSGSCVHFSNEWMVKNKELDSASVPFDKPFTFVFK